MLEDKDADGGIAVVLAAAIALIAIGIAVFIGSWPLLRAGAAGASAACSI